MSLSRFNQGIKRRGYNIELVKADGYFYWDGDAFDKWPSEMVAHFNHLSYDKWLAVFDANIRSFPI